MFRWDVFWQFLFSPFFLQAAWTTLWISVVAQFCGVVLGLFIALMRMSRFPFLTGPARAYIWFFRGSPLLVQALPRSLAQGPSLSSNCSSSLPSTTCCLPLYGASSRAGLRIGWIPIVH